MHILHFSGVYNWGGGEYHIENLCTELSSTNPEILNTVFCVKHTAFHKRLEKTTIKYITAPLSIKIDLRYVFKLGKFCKKEKIDLIHIHDPIALQLAIIADKIFKLPPFVFSKKTSFPVKSRKKTLYKYNYPKIKKILCVSKKTQDVIKKAIKHKSKLITIYHGTNLKTKSTETPFLLREKYNIPHDKIIIGNIANHIRAKNLETFIKVVDNLVNTRKRTDFIFLQMGTFSERSEALFNQVKLLNLKKHIIFTDYIPNASNFIPQFDISLMTSQSEGLPQFIYESMYFKTPIISTDPGGIPEVITHKTNGLLAPIHNDVMLTEHILNLSNSKELQDKFKANSFEKLIDKFTTSNMAMQTIQVYKDILKPS